MNTPPISSLTNAIKPAPKRAKRTMRRTDPTSEEPVPVKKTLFSKESKSEIFEHLGRFYWFTTSQYGGESYYHIRIYEQKDGKNIPTKRGIYLLPTQVKQLIDCAGTIEQSADSTFQQNPETTEYSSHLGFGTYLTVKKFNGCKWFDIRRFFKPDGCTDPVHTRIGAMLRPEEFARIVQLIPRILEHSPAIKDIQLCDCLFGNQLGYLICKECNPFNALSY